MAEMLGKFLLADLLGFPMNHAWWGFPVLHCINNLNKNALKLKKVKKLTRVEYMNFPLCFKRMGPKEITIAIIILPLQNKEYAVNQHQINKFVVIIVSLSLLYNVFFLLQLYILFGFNLYIESIIFLALDVPVTFQLLDILSTFFANDGVFLNHRNLRKTEQIQYLKIVIMLAQLCSFTT